MTQSSDFDQAAFVRALLDPDLLPPGQTDAGKARRLDVYRNNVIAGLIGALCERFPVCLRLVGDTFFRAMARTYVRASLPRKPMLFEYGEDFAEFIAGFDPASGLPYLPDVARLEYAAGRAYHAADAPPLSRDMIRSLPPERLDAATASLHPSTQVVRSRYPIVSIWRENMSSDPPGTVVLDHAEDALVVRARVDVEIRALPPGGAHFVKTLMGSGTFGKAAEEAGSISTDFDLTGCLTTLLACEAFSAIDIGRSGLAGAAMEHGIS